MKKWIALFTALLSLQVHAYTGKELREDCQSAEESFAKNGRLDPRASPGAARCVGYVEGFADGYAISDFLAESVGVKLNAFCLPPGRDLSYRLVRAVLAHLERQPPNPEGSTATLVASALAKTFPCTEALEPKK
jgi:Rap1a immunity proteins